MKVRVYAGFLGRLFFGRKLKKLRFFPRREDGTRFYQRHIDDSRPDELKRVVRFCRRRLLPYHVSDDRMERKSGYRNRFLRETRGILGTRLYLCAYCGKPLGASRLSVDHIIPVKQASSSRFYRRLLTWRRIRTVNDVRNLAPSCVRCNLRKSARGGWWVIRGIFGRHWWWVLLRELLWLAAGSVLLYGFYHFLRSVILRDQLISLFDIFFS